MNKLKIITLLFFILLLISFIPVFAYSNSSKVGFMGINIGMTRDEVLNYADKNNLIHVPKNRDVELFPVEQRKILTLSVNPEIPYIYLQFYNDKLYAITVIFNEKYVDYYTLCSRVEKKYGKYTDLSPVWRKWKIDDIEVKVEKPAVVKYIALKEFLEVTNFKKNQGLPEAKRLEILLNGL